MTRFYIFIIRAVLGGIFAVILSRFFYPQASIAGVMGLAIFLVGLAYVMEAYHRRRKEKQGKTDL